MINEYFIIILKVIINVNQRYKYYYYSFCCCSWISAMTVLNKLEAYRRSSLRRHDGRRAHARCAPHDLLMRMRRDVTSAGNRNTVCH